MDQWVKEIKNKTAPGRLKVCSYHGPQRGKRESSHYSREDLRQHKLRQGNLIYRRTLQVADKLHKFDVVVSWVMR